MTNLQEENTRFLQAQIQYLSGRLAELANENAELLVKVEELTNQNEPGPDDETGPKPRAPRKSR